MSLTSSPSDLPPQLARHASGPEHRDYVGLVPSAGAVLQTDRRFSPSG
jgi:hypothetical protein